MLCPSVREEGQEGGGEAVKVGARELGQEGGEAGKVGGRTGGRGELEVFLGD